MPFRFHFSGAAASKIYNPGASPAKVFYVVVKLIAETCDSFSKLRIIGRAICILVDKVFVVMMKNYCWVHHFSFCKDRILFRHCWICSIFSVRILFRAADHSL